MIPDQSEAERQAAEKDAAEERATARRTAEVDDHFNRILRGQPSAEQEQAKASLREKTKQRLEEIALDESEDDETRQWAEGVLSGKTDLNGDPIKRQPTGPRADGGEGTSMTTPGQWNPFRPLTFTEQVQQALLDKRYGVRHTENHKLPRGDK